MTTFLDVYLKQIAQVVQRRRRRSKVALLLDRCGFGVTLRDDDASQIGAMFARHFLPYRFALMVAELNRPAGLHRIQKDAPSIIGHFHVAEVGPAVALDTDCGAQVNVESVAAVWSGFAPPVYEAGLPVFERTLQCLIGAQVDVVWNPVCRRNARRTASHVRSQLNRALLPVPYTFNAPPSPTALGRVKIQFCHADSRPNTRVSMVSVTPKRRLASMPVKASGDMLARSSR